MVAKSFPGKNRSYLFNTFEFLKQIHMYYAIWFSLQPLEITFIVVQLQSHVQFFATPWTAVQ